MADTKEEPWPRRTEAQEYLDKHRILELFDNFTAQLIYFRPGQISLNVEQDKITRI